MKVAFNTRIQDGPWGGGNRFAAALAEALEARGDQVRFDLSDPDVDVVVIVDTRARNPMVTATPGAILRYVTARNPRALVLHRINECDERKGTRGMNARLKLANYMADRTVFIGAWLQDLDLWRRESPGQVCRNGADPRVFHAEGHRPWDGQGPLRLVTHHWGAHAFKGFDVYRHIDDLVGRGEVEFTYVGNLPADVRFAHATHLAPLDGEALAAELRRHGVYVTASINEPAGMHHIEGALCGLPLLYRESGALPEYCGGFGESFAGPDDFEGALERMAANYTKWREALADYPHTSEAMCACYLDTIDGLMAERDAILARRRLWRSPLAALLNQVPW